MRLTTEQQQECERLLPRVLRMATRIRPGDDDIQGVASLALCEAVVAGVPARWMMKRVKCRILNALKKKRPDTLGGLEDEIGDMPQPDATECLPDADREIAHKFWVEGMTIRQIHKSLRMSRRAVTIRLRSIKRRLAREFDCERSQPRMASQPAVELRGDSAA
jgi:hypothetical protein